MTSKKNRLRVIPLGGLDGIGKNMTVIEYGNDMLVIDAGLMFPDDDTPGVDLLLPDYNYILKRKEKLRGIVITHGHEDHTGALPYLLRDLGQPVPILGTKLTLGLIKGKLEEHRIIKPKLREIVSGGHVSLGVFGLDFIAVNHSIPDGVAVFIRTPVGNVLHTGDFKLDQTPIDGRFTDYSALSKASKAGVTLLLSDSTGAESLGSTPSEAAVGQALRRVCAEADQRVIVASFASHIHRLQQVCDAAVASGRRVAVTGRSMLNNTKIARELGYLHIAEEDIVDAYEMKDLPPERVVVLSTGSQGEPLSALARMANGDHMPVHGETRHLHAHAKLAASVGIAEENIFVLENGDCLELSEDGAHVGDHVESGTVYVDGLSVGDIGHVILRDRQMLASDGVALVIVAIDSQNGRVVAEPEIVVRGFVLSGTEDEDVLTELRGRVAKVLARTSGEGATDHGVIKKALRDSLSSFIWERSRSRPMIIPVVMEV